MSYFGIDGKPCLQKTAYAGCKATYDELGNQTSESYFGTDGKPCLNKEGDCRMEGHVRRAGEPNKHVLLRHERRTHDRPQTGISSPVTKYEPNGKVLRSEDPWIAGQTTHAR